MSKLKAAGAVGLLVIYWVGVFVAFNRVDRHLKTHCPDDIRRRALVDDPDGLAPVPGEPASTLEGPADAVKLDFTSFRSAKTVPIEFSSDDPVPGSVKDATLVLGGLVHDGELNELLVLYRVRVVASQAILDVCVDPRPPAVPAPSQATSTQEQSLNSKQDGFWEWLFGTMRTRPGTYTSKAYLRQDGLSAAPVTIEVRVQGRYLWLLAPTIFLAPMLATWLIYDEKVKDWRKRAIPLIAGGGAAATAFGVQGLRNPSWGGIASVFSLIAVMYSASVAAVGTAAKAPGTTPEREVNGD